MNSPLAQCPECRASLLDADFNRPDLAPCPTCGVPLQIEIFPAFFRRIAPGRDAEAVMLEGESSCFYHPAKKAVTPCEACGRFLCALCDCELNGRHYCPACLETGKTKGKIKNLENRRMLYDSMALSVAIIPVLVIFGVYFTFITAPIALFLGIRHWNTPRSLVHRTRFRLIAAIVLALLQLGGWAFVIYSIAANI